MKRDKIKYTNNLTVNEEQETTLYKEAMRMKKLAEEAKSAGVPGLELLYRVENRVPEIFEKYNALTIKDKLAEDRLMQEIDEGLRSKDNGYTIDSKIFD